MPASPAPHAPAQAFVFDEALIRRYAGTGPRYTSYPTAVEFHERFGVDDYLAAVRASVAAAPARPLSLYFHLPFCATVCYYCACNKVVTRNRARAAPYLDYLHRELELQAALFPGTRRVDQLHWGGGTPTFLDEHQMQRLMDASRAAFVFADDADGEYSIEVDPRETGEGSMAFLRGLGFNRLSLGVQDFDARVQRAVNRIQSEAQTLGVMDAARAAGFRSINVDLIYGLPHQTVESFLRTVARIVAAAPDRISVFNYAHLPARFKVQRQIEESALPAASEKLRILQETAAALTAAGYCYIGMDHFARPDDELAVAQREGRLHRNFQGYTTRGDSDLVAMGVTGIGAVGDCYYQNAREIDAYGAAIEAGRLPVFRGITLDEDDRLRRAVISELMCNFMLEFRAIEERFGVDFEVRFADELAALGDMQTDGLLRLDGGGIEILPAGRLLIRSVCMVFDRYLDAATPPAQFSKVI